MEPMLDSEEQKLDDAISDRSIQLSRQVRQRAAALRLKAEPTPLAADALILATEVGDLCDYVEQLHEKVKIFLSNIETVPLPVDDSETSHLSPEDRKALLIQREIHELPPTALGTLKALFMWQDTPEDRLREKRDRERFGK